MDGYMKDNYIFIHETDERRVEITIKGTYHTWQEMLEYYQDFLNGCGYREPEETRRNQCLDINLHARDADN